MIRTALLLAAALTLAACGGEGTQISINAKSDEGGNSVISTAENGQVAINAPGFAGKFKLPGFKLDVGDFEINGVHLYPGSKISDLKIDSDKSGGKDEDRVAVHFESPAAAATVQSWFREQMGKHGFTVEPDGTGLKGTTDEGDPITLRITPDGDAKSKSVLELSDKK